MNIVEPVGAAVRARRAGNLWQGKAPSIVAIGLPLVSSLVSLALVGTGCGDRSPMEPAIDRDIRRFEEDGIRLLERGADPAAEERFLRALALAEATDRLDRKARALYLLAQVHRSMGKDTEALAELAGSRDLFVAAGQPAGAARCLAAEGALQLVAGRLDLAKASLERAETLATSAGAEGVLAEVHVNWAALALLEGDAARAESAAKRALDLDPLDPVRADALQNLARALARSGKRAEAKAALEEAVEIERAGDRRIGLASALESLGALALEEKRSEEAAAFYARAAGVWAAAGRKMEADRACDRAGIRAAQPAAQPAVEAEVEARPYAKEASIPRP